jgi:hypothetical protein
MRADNRADWLFVLMAGEGFATASEQASSTGRSCTDD